MKINWKTSRNEKQKYLNEEKLALGENENTSALINIAQEDDSNIFELLENLWQNNLQFIIFKCSGFCLLVTFGFILLLLYTQMFLILWFSWLENERKKQFKSQFFSNPPLLFHTPRLLETWEYTGIYGSEKIRILAYFTPCVGFWRFQGIYKWNIGVKYFSIII